MERSMAHIERIVSIEPIDGADAIEVAKILNWKVVVKKGEFSVGDLVTYLEVDSWVPIDVAPFLQKGVAVKEFNGVPGNKLKTIKLRGQISQGLVLPLKKDFLETVAAVVNYIGRGDGAIRMVEEGDDVSDFLGIQKWEAPEGNAQLGGQSKGNFPSEFPKTDQERIQNIRPKDFAAWQEKNLTFEVTEKLEGSSMTAFLIEDTFGVCSRNVNLKEEEGNTFWDTSKKYDIEAVLRKMTNGDEDVCAAFQGELVGPGIQGNIYGLTEHKFYLFDAVARNQDYCPPNLRRVISDWTPVLHTPLINPLLAIKDYSIDDLIAMADGESMLAKGVAREGLVFKCNEDPSISFKIVSNAYLLKQKE